MRVLRLDIRNFRGFRNVTVHPNEHVVLAGEPRAGRSTILEALRRVFAPDSTRLPLTDDLDFNHRNRSKPIVVEVVLGELGDALEQDFFDYLELWDAENSQVVLDATDPTDIDRPDVEFVLRLSYRAAWNSDAEIGDHWVEFPKGSDAETGQVSRVPRRLLQLLPVVFVDATSKPLGFGVRSDFRRLVEQSRGENFSSALEQLVEQVENGAKAFSETDQVAAALDAVLGPVRRSLGIGSRPGSDVIQFLPDGGSLGGILRSLAPSLSISRQLALPLARHGSTTAEMLRAAEALALEGQGDVVAFIDDFGESLDLSTAVHLASNYRSTFSQVWMSTRRGAVAEVFRPDELIRLIRPRNGLPRIHQGAPPASKAERVAARHLAIQLLPAISSKTLVVLEGPHDRAGLSAVAVRRLEVNGKTLPAADGIFLAHAGAADQSGGVGAVVKLATFAVGLGFRVVVVLDGDRAGDQVESEAASICDAVVRLPPGHAIERALVEGISDNDIRKSLELLRAASGVTLPSDALTATGAALRRIACDTIKSSGGLHAQFVELLPRRTIPPVAEAVLDTIREAAAGRATGVIAL